MKSIHLKIYKCNITNSQDRIDGIVHKRGQWKKGINYLIAKQGTGQDSLKSDFFFIEIKIEN